MPKSPSELGTRLRETLDNLIDAARQVARPGWIWIAGFFYPGFEVSLEVMDVENSLDEIKSSLIDSSPFSIDVLSDGLSAAEEALMDGGGVMIAVCLGLLLALPVLLLASRLSVGLAACSMPETWQQLGGGDQPPGLQSAWQAGEGMTWSAFGIRVLLGLMRIVALLVVGLPALFFQDFLPEVDTGGLSFLLAIVYLPLAGILILYFIVLAALHQLALHSLVQNRRGMTSALQHAWRLFRVEAPISISYLLVEASCVLVFLLVAWAVHLISPLFCCMCLLPMLILLALEAFQGVLRAAFWARAYRQMGGATSSDTIGGIGASPSQG